MYMYIIFDHVFLHFPIRKKKLAIFINLLKNIMYYMYIHMYTVTACTVCVFSDLFTYKNIHHLQPLEQFVHVELLERDRNLTLTKRSITR